MKKKHIVGTLSLQRQVSKTAQTNSAAIHLNCVLVPIHYGIFTIKHSPLQIEHLPTRSRLETQTRWGQHKFSGISLPFLSHPAPNLAERIPIFSLVSQKVQFKNKDKDFECFALASFFSSISTQPFTSVASYKERYKGAPNLYNVSSLWYICKSKDCTSFICTLPHDVSI